MGEMFRECKKLLEINIRGWKTEKLTNINSMFYDCSQLSQIDLSRLENTSS